MNYTIQELLTLGNFILLPGKDYYTNFAGKICSVSKNPKNNKYELICVDNPRSCYITSLDTTVLAYTKKDYPEYFL